LTFANGVVWLAAGTGVLHAYDAATGATVAARSMSADVGDVCMNAGGGVAIARNTVYVVCGDAGIGYSTGPEDGASGWVIAYRLG
jgi:outer membrane protein assembly factor BamB